MSSLLRLVSLWSYPFNRTVRVKEKVHSTCDRANACAYIARAAGDCLINLRPWSESVGRTLLLLKLYL